jgi:hypothetical protein
MTMRKSAFILAAVLAASFSTAALAAKRKPAPPADPATAAQANTVAFLHALFGPGSAQPEPTKVGRHHRKAKG